MKNKYLKKLVSKLIALSFKDGRIVEPQAVRSIKALKSLPGSSSIEALTEYVRGLKRMERKHTMYVETVIPLSETQLKKIRKIVEKRVRVTKVITQINPSILGGFILKVGDEVWDESILDKVSQVKEAIIHGRSD